MSGSLEKDEGGREYPVYRGHRSQYYFRTASITGELSFHKNTMLIWKGSQERVRVKLDKPVVIEKGLRFAVREGYLTIGTGVINKVSPM